MLKRYHNWWATNMEVYLAISPQDLLMVLDVPKPQGAGIVASSTALTNSVLMPATTQSAPTASTLSRFFFCEASQEDSPQKTQALNLLKSKRQQKKMRLLLEPEKEVPEVQAEEEEEEEEEEENQGQESPLKRRKRVTVSSSNLVQDETTIQRKQKRKMTVSPSDFVEDPVYEAAAKAVKQEHSKAIIVFERAEKRRSPIIANTPETTTTIEPILPMRTPSISVEVDQLQNVRTIQIILPLPKPAFDVPSLRPSIPKFLSFGLTPYLPHMTFDPPQFGSLSNLALPPSSKEIPTAISSLMSSVPSTTALSAPLMSTDEVDIFEARLASLFDIPSTSPIANDEAELLVLANSLLEILESSSSSSSKPSEPLMDLETCLELKSVVKE
ncbi:histone H3.v1-like [Camellia sinensis]|uniref:histone H3.v1-like n=1 Tax=Camellia sinensis TaxID=4442 RepID=UPI001035CF7E|nr:histone H3.v1-like [Camellia sinensis]